MVAYLRTILLRLRSSSATPSSLTALTSSSLTQTTSYYPHSSPILPLLQNTNAQPPLTDALLNPCHSSSHNFLFLELWVLLLPSPNVSPLLLRMFLSLCHQSATSRARHSRVSCTRMPQFLTKGMLELFPGAKLKSEKLCAIVLSEKTENDMTYHGLWQWKRRGKSYSYWNISSMTVLRRSAPD